MFARRDILDYTQGMSARNTKGPRRYAVSVCVAVCALALGCTSVPKVSTSGGAAGPLPPTASASAAPFNRADFEKALAGRNLDLLASYSSSERGSLGAAAGSADRERAQVRYEALRQEILLVPASRDALAPNLPALAALLAQPEAKHFSSGERKKLESVLTSYASPRSQAEKYRSSELDPRVERVSPALLSSAARAPETQLGPLVAALIRGERDSFSQIKLIHDWIAETITYDVAMLSKNTVTNQDLASVLGSRRAVCSGYAALFERMAKLAGFEVKTARGFTKGLGGDFDFTSLSSHAWNIVRIGDLWYPIDTTFDAGAFDATGGRGQYHKRYSTDYLFAPPIQLRFTHFPDDPLDQLSAAPIGREAFRAQALVTPEYFAYNIALKRVAGAAGDLSALAGSFAANRDFKIEFDAPEGLLMDAALYDAKGKEIDRSALASHPGSTAWNIDFATPVGGMYTVRVFAGPRDHSEKASSSTLSGVLQFKLQSPGALGAYPLPKLYERYQYPSGEFLTSPRAGTLAKGSTARFAYRSKANYVAIIYENTFVPLKNAGGGDFALDFKIPATSTVKLGVSDDNIHYGIVLAWDVR